ncbi:MAG: flagellar transcriptional regulator FlhC [Thiobacillaceae bacterium]
MGKKSLISEVKETQLAIELIKVGARLQVLESETSLSRERLLKLYKEVKGVSPPKGMLPFSADWFLTWMPNVHASLFINIYRTISKHTDCEGIEAVLKSYRLYQEFLVGSQTDEVLSFTRAWTLVRFFESRMLQTTECCKCGGHFVVHPNDLHDNYECGLCHMPSRAGKTKKAKMEASAVQANSVPYTERKQKQEQVA